MYLTDAEIKRSRGFGNSYLRGQLPVMLRMEQSVCGCNFGSTSWATQKEIDLVSSCLELGPGRKLLDLGSGAGWPSLYLARKSGCDVTLVDLPIEGLLIAAGRAKSEALQGVCHVVVGNGSSLPLAAGQFDAINHSDVLCCLPGKIQALSECLRVLKPKGQMIFSVISISPGLSPADEALALAAGPGFVATDITYPDLLGQTGWTVDQETDLTPDFFVSAQDVLETEDRNRADLVAVLGEGVWQARQQQGRLRLSAIEDCLLRRTLYQVKPVKV